MAVGGDGIECQSHERGLSEIIKEKGREESKRGEEDEWREGNGTMRDGRVGMRELGEEEKLRVSEEKRKREEKNESEKERWINNGVKTGRKRRRAGKAGTSGEKEREQWVVSCQLETNRHSPLDRGREQRRRRVRRTAWRKKNAKLQGTSVFASPFFYILSFFKLRAVWKGIRLNWQLPPELTKRVQWQTYRTAFSESKLVLIKTTNKSRRG